MNKDMIRTIKVFEKEFLEANLDLYKNNRMEFVKQREAFISKKIDEMRDNER